VTSSNSTILVVRERNKTVESCHTGSIAIVPAPEETPLAWGDQHREVLPRSAIKLIHALPFVMSGAIERFSVIPAEIALAASSHVAHPEQRATLAAFADRLGIAGRELVCGPDWPLGRQARRGEGEPITPFHNNNSGKHLGIIATCLAHGEPVAGYHEPGHPAQARLVAITTALCGIPAPVDTALDNCGLQTFPLPLSALARGMARLGQPEWLEPPQRKAAERLFEAIASAPDFLAGPGRLTTEITRVTRGRIIAKGGSEGIYAVVDRSKRRGIALKVDDGSGEAASAALVELLAAVGSIDGEEAERLRTFTRFWQHAFALERSPVLSFPFLAEFRRS
jgi:L-asparaginase II